MTTVLRILCPLKSEKNRYIYIMEGIQYNKSNSCFPILAENQLTGCRFYGKFQYLGGGAGRGRACKLCSARCIVRGSNTLCWRFLHCAEGKGIPSFQTLHVLCLSLSGVIEIL